jgi:hypothetical protein
MMLYDNYDDDTACYNRKDPDDDDDVDCYDKDDDDLIYIYIQ